jgi:sugar-specific transcriptional regulator TrmB
MNSDRQAEHAVTILQGLGLKEYEARCFVALTRLPTAKAREIGEVADVPRTRVYDAVEQLAELGLIETEEASPKRFRAVGIDEALTILRRKYDRQITELGGILESVEAIRDAESNPEPSGIWTISGITTIRSRAAELVEAGDEEVVYLIGDESVLSEALLEELADASERGVPVYVGTATDRIYDRVDRVVPDAHRFESWVEWLWSPGTPGDAWSLGQILVVDRRAVLLSAHQASPHDEAEDSAVWTTGVGNGLGIVAERLLDAGIERLDDRTTSDPDPGPDSDVSEGDAGDESAG